MPIGPTASNRRWRWPMAASPTGRSGCVQAPGRGLAASEMTIDDPRFWNTPKSRTSMDHSGEPA